jgi:hypothetical protein
MNERQLRSATHAELKEIARAEEMDRQSRVLWLKTFTEIMGRGAGLNSAGAAEIATRSVKSFQTEFNAIEIGIDLASGPDFSATVRPMTQDEIDEIPERPGS